MNCNNCNDEMIQQSPNHCLSDGFSLYWCPTCGTIFRRDMNNLTATGEQWVTPAKSTLPDEPDEPEPPEPSWIDKHSVNCYFCEALFDEREGDNADAWNGNDGGSICPQCIKVKDAEADAQTDAQTTRAAGETEIEGRQ